MKRKLYDNSQVYCSEAEEENDLQAENLQSSASYNDYDPAEMFQIPKCSSTQDTPRTIKDFYRMPPKEEVCKTIYRTCRFIMEEMVEVSPLNRVYQGNCVPQGKTRQGDPHSYHISQ